jgi:hypothetical protein
MPFVSDEYLKASEELKKLLNVKSSKSDMIETPEDKSNMSELTKKQKSEAAIKKLLLPYDKIRQKIHYVYDNINKDIKSLSEEQIRLNKELHSEQITANRKAKLQSELIKIMEILNNLLKEKEKEKEKLNIEKAELDRKNAIIEVKKRVKTEKPSTDQLAKPTTSPVVKQANKPFDRLEQSKKVNSSLPRENIQQTKKIRKTLGILTQNELLNQKKDLFTRRNMDDKLKAILKNNDTPQNLNLKSDLKAKQNADLEENNINKNIEKEIQNIQLLTKQEEIKETQIEEIQKERNELINNIKIQTSEEEKKEIKEEDNKEIKKGILYSIEEFNKTELNSKDKDETQYKAKFKLKIDYFFKIYDNIIKYDKYLTTIIKLNISELGIFLCDLKLLNVIYNKKSLDEIIKIKEINDGYDKIKKLLEYLSYIKNSDIDGVKRENDIQYRMIKTFYDKLKDPTIVNNTDIDTMKNMDVRMKTVIEFYKNSIEFKIINNDELYKIIENIQNKIKEIKDKEKLDRENFENELKKIQDKKKIKKKIQDEMIILKNEFKILKEEKNKLTKEIQDIQLKFKYEERIQASYKHSKQVFKTQFEQLNSNYSEICDKYKDFFEEKVHGGDVSLIKKSEINDYIIEEYSFKTKIDDIYDLKQNIIIIKDNINYLKEEKKLHELKLQHELNKKEQLLISIEIMKKYINVIKKEIFDKNDKIKQSVYDPNKFEYPTTPIYDENGNLIKYGNFNSPSVNKDRSDAFKEILENIRKPSQTPENEIIESVSSIKTSPEKVENINSSNNKPTTTSSKKPSPVIEDKKISIKQPTMVSSKTQSPVIEDNNLFINRTQEVLNKGNKINKIKTDQQIEEERLRVERQKNLQKRREEKKQKKIIKNTARQDERIQDILNDIDDKEFNDKLNMFFLQLKKNKGGKTKKSKKNFRKTRKSKK